MRRHSLLPKEAKISSTTHVQLLQWLHGKQQQRTFLSEKADFRFLGLPRARLPTSWRLLGVRGIYFPLYNNPHTLEQGEKLIRGGIEENTNRKEECKSKNEKM